MNIQNLQKETFRQTLFYFAVTAPFFVERNVARISSLCQIKSA